MVSFKPLTQYKLPSTRGADHVWQIKEPAVIKLTKSSCVTKYLIHRGGQQSDRRSLAQKESCNRTTIPNMAANLQQNGCRCCNGPIKSSDLNMNILLCGTIVVLCPQTPVN